jgi:hypothetical protein
MATRMQQRRGTAAQWISTNSGNGPVLNSGEIGYESDTNKFKIGDGVNHWLSLAYFVDLATTIAGAPGLLNSLDELAAAIGDDPAFFTTVATNLTNHQNDTTSIHGIADTSLLVTTTGTQTLTNKTITTPVGLVKADVGLGSVDNTADTIKPVSTAQATAIATAKSEAITAAGIDATTKATVARDTAITAASNYTDASVASLIDTAPAALNTLNELAAAINDDASYAATMTASLSTKANTSYVDAQITSTLNTVGGNLSTHASNTLGIHGIADTAQLATTAYVNEAVGNVTDAQAAAAGVGIDWNVGTDQYDIDSTVATKTYADTAVSTHSSDTTYVHGIADTALLATTTYVTDQDNIVRTDAAIAAASLLTGATKTNITITGNKDGLFITAENGVTDSTTDNLTEGANNLYFSNERAQDAIGNSVGTGLSYNDATGTVSVDITAIQAKVANVDDTEIGYLNGVTSAIQTQIDTKAALVSPTFTGTVTLPTGTVSSANINWQVYATEAALPAASGVHGMFAHVHGTGSAYYAHAGSWVKLLDAPTAATTYATPAQVATAKSEVITEILGAGVPAALNTLDELAAALGDDANFAASVTTSLGLKAPLASPTFTGTATIPTLTLTNPLTAANGGTGLSSLGTGVSTFLGTPTSANFAAMITNEDGSGNVVLSEIATSAQTASYTLVLADRGKLVEMNVGSANILTVPLNSSVAYPVGTQIDILQVGSGQTTVAATIGVTVNATPGLKIRAQWGGATLIKRAENSWVLIGDLTA